MAVSYKGVVSPTNAPRLPISPTEYNQRFTDQLLNVLRLYFGTIDNFTQVITSGSGSSALRFPYGAFQSTATQTATVNTATLLTFNQTDFTNDITMVSGSKIHVASPGIYNLQFSVQVENTDTADQDVSIWLRQGSGSGAATDIAGSTGLISVPGKHGTTPGHAINGWNYYISMAADDYIQIYWSTTNITVSIAAYPATTLPTRPSTASAVATLSFVSAL